MRLIPNGENDPSTLYEALSVRKGFQMTKTSRTWKQNLFHANKCKTVGRKLKDPVFKRVSNYFVTLQWAYPILYN